MKKFLIINDKSENFLPKLKDNIFHTAITSPPYWQMRDFFISDQLGQEATPEEYVTNLVEILREVKRVLRKDGTLWLNIGDGYNSEAGFIRAQESFKRKGRIKGSSDRKFLKHPEIKRKDLVGVPWMVAYALRKDGWYLRCDIVWQKTNPMPDGAKDRPTRSHEYFFLLSKSQRYFYDYYRCLEKTKNQPEKIQGFGAKEQHGTYRQDQKRTFEHYGKRNRRSVWTTSVASYKGKHYATFPIKLIKPCVMASTSEKGCCPKCGTPWCRITEKVKQETDNKKGYNLVLQSKGWKPRCKCGIKETSCCLVLDPFSGMSTTGIVAMDYYQDYVGVEPSQEYVKMARERLIEFDMYREEEPKLLEKYYK